MAIILKSPQEVAAQQTLIESQRGTAASEADIMNGAANTLIQSDTIPALKLLRQKQEKVFTGPINSFLDHSPLSLAEESREISVLKERTFNLSALTEEEKVKLASGFPSGNFLYHGARTSELIMMFISGDIANSRLLEMRQIVAGRGISSGRRSLNKGYEGISWSINGVDALPGDRFHMAGFIAAPESVLNDEYHLEIPPQPAPYEVLQVSNAELPESGKDHYKSVKEGKNEGDVTVSIENMYFVSPYKDAEIWLKVIARTGNRPAGILLYDDKEVRLENFASTHDGHHNVLTNLFRLAIKPGKGYIDYSEILGGNFDDSMRSGRYGQFIDGQFLNDTATVEKVGDGLVIKKPKPGK